jgi:hypothetical protein
MRLFKLFHLVTLLGFSNLGVAGWVALPIGPPMNSPLSTPGTYYVDPQWVSRQGGIGRGSWMFTQSAPQPLRAYKTDRRIYRSQIVEGEFNCGTREYRLLTNRFYSGPNGTGELLRTAEGDSWRDLKNGYEIWTYVWQQACK